MTGLVRAILALGLMLGLAGCGAAGFSFGTYIGPQITQVQVHKADRKLYLIAGSEVVESYDIALGFAPEGPKEFEGDGKTPEGLYYISHRNPKSAYHLSLGISYPNDEDRARAEAAGKEPGGDIFIHGGPRGPIESRDWTWGCVAVSDQEIERIYAMVEPGTPIWLLP